MSIKVLLVDDSPTSRLMLSQMINNAPDMQLVGQAADGLQAIEMVQRLHPDLILMDVVMPKMDGVQATREIMSVNPTPIVVISANTSATEDKIAFEAMHAGAVSVLKKPGVTSSLSIEDSMKMFLNTVRAMSSVRVIRHVKAGATASTGQPPVQNVAASSAQVEIIAIASSTGGPQTLGEILKKLKPTFNLPIVIVQHIAPDFVTPLVDWLSTLTQIPVRVAQMGARPLPGTIYIAPGGKHLQISPSRRFELVDNPSNVPHIPSGDVLLESVARSYGSRAVGVVLTGMGSDGARGLRAMYESGSMTIAQDEASCIVFGMPKEAIALGAARLTLPPPEISKLIQQYSS